MWRAVSPAAREAASIHEDVGEEQDSPAEGVQCWRYSGESAADDCYLEYGNGWLITADSVPGLTGNGTEQDLKVLAAVLASVKANNPFEQAVQTHANM